jgi:polyferredoxin
MMSAAEQIVNGSFIIFGIFLLGGLFFGRVFCGWLQPCGGLQEIMFLVNAKKNKNGKGNYLKYGIWFLWLLLLISIVSMSGGYKKIDFFYSTEKGISISNIYAYIIYYGVMVVFLILSLFFGKRAACHYICWMSPFMIVGRKASILFNLPSLRIKINNERCTNCLMCNTVCPMSLDVNLLVNKQNTLEHSECILCGECIDNCPSDVLAFYFGRK